jgi:hypothetical protein
MVMLQGKCRRADIGTSSARVVGLEGDIKKEAMNAVDECMAPLRMRDDMSLLLR